MFNPPIFHCHLFPLSSFRIFISSEFLLYVVNLFLVIRFIFKLLFFSFYFWLLMLGMFNKFFHRIIFFGVFYRFSVSGSFRGEGMIMIAWGLLNFQYRENFSFYSLCLHWLSLLLTAGLSAAPALLYTYKPRAFTEVSARWYTYTKNYSVEVYMLP